MGYTNTTLTQLITQISTLLDDTQAKYWTQPEIQSAVYEALLVWGAYANYWRARGQFGITMSDVQTQNPYYSLPAKLPTLRRVSITINDVIMDIQRMLLEPANGYLGSGMSGQIQVQAITTAVADARNRLVQDVRFPISATQLNNVFPSDGVVDMSDPSDQLTVYAHRLVWKDTLGGVRTVLWREDEWAADHGLPLWPQSPATPYSYSEATMAPLRLQLVPPPSNSGVVEMLRVTSLDLLSTFSPTALLNVPDEWAHAIKYAALSQLLNSDSQIKDETRAQYAESRYQQAVALARDARSVLRVTVNGTPLMLDTITAIDAGVYYWMNQTSKPYAAGALYDMIALAPVPDTTYGIGVDVVQTAPLPTLIGPTTDQQIQVGEEDLDHIKEYTLHVLAFKCGGTDFTSTLARYDSFMKAVGVRNAGIAAKVRYLAPLFAQPQKEWGVRPDYVESKV